MWRRRTGRWLGTTVVAVLSAACGSSDLLGPDADQGIEGLVLLGPMCPVFSEENPCPDQPYEAWITLRRSDGGSVTRVRSDQDGRFRVGLRPGDYVLDPDSGDPLPVAGPQDVTVVEGVYTEVVVSYDTGIR